MLTSSHRVARLDFTASVADLDMGFGLRPRLERLGWELMPAEMERVFEAVGPADMHLRIDRLILDLGTVGPEHLEEDALAALQAALSEALAEALHAARYAPSDAARLIAPAALQVEDFESYLASGRLPSARRADGFDAGDRLRTLIAEQPEALIAMLRRLARNRNALERLLLHAGETGFRQLLDLLAPADAAVILALLADALLAHRDRRIALPARLTEPGLDRLLRIATLEFLLRDAGSQFNRRRFLAHLLGREAAALGIDYRLLLQLLGSAVEASRARTGFRSSLPVVLAELLAEIGADDTIAVADPAPAVSEAAAVAAAQSGAFDELLDLVRRRADDGAALDALVRRLTESMFAELIERLDPGHSAAILATLGELMLVHRSEPLPVLIEAELEPALRSLTLHYLLRRSGSRFDRRHFLRFLLEREAARVGVGYAELVRLFSAASASLPPRPAAHWSLPAELAALIGQLAQGAAAATAPRHDFSFDPAIGAADRAASRTSPQDDVALQAAMAAAQATALDAAPRDDFDLAAAVAAARRGDLEALLALARARAIDAEALAALVAALPEPLFAGLVRRAAPSSAAAILADVDALIELHRRSPLLLLSASTFAELARTAALRLMLAGSPRRFHRRRWLRRLIVELAERAGGSARALRRALAEAVAAPAGAAAQSVAAIAELVRAVEWGMPADRLPDADLILALEGGGAAAAEALRAVAGDEARLARLAAGLEPRERERLLTALDGVAGAAVAADLRLLERLHSAAPLLAVDSAAFAQLLWTLAVGFLIRRGPARFDRAGLGRHLAEGIARFAGRRPADVGAGLDDGIGRLADRDAVAARALMADYFIAHAVLPDRHATADPRRAVERYLSTGQPAAAGRSLPVLAASDRAWLAATARRLARAQPGRVPALIERLLAWLLPEELIECLAPGTGARAARWADAAGAVDLSAWQPVVAAVLAGKRPSFGDIAGGASRRLDRVALLAEWLDHGPEEVAVHPPAADLDGLTFAELHLLFGGPDGERGFARLWRAIRPLRADRRQRLFERLVPWATQPGGPLSATLDRLGPRRRLLALTRAAADALQGRQPDLARLAAPVAEPAPPPPEPAPPPAPEREADSARLFAWLDGAPASAAESEALIRHFARLSDQRDSALAGYLAKRRGQARARARWAALLPPEALGRLVRLLLPSGAQAWLDSAILLAAAARQGATFGERDPDPVRVWTVLLDLVAPAGAPAPAQGVALLVERLADGDARRADRLRARALRLARQGGHVAVAAALLRSAPERAAAKRPEARPKPPHDPPPAPADEMPPEPRDAIFIDNAGLVLLSPYLPTLFERLGLLTDTDTGPRLIGIESMSRGVHLLQYIVDECCNRPEPMLVLNKLLCGLPSAQPVEPSIEPSDADRATCDSLIAAVIANWPSIANSSPAALRETFLQRDGRLLHGDDGWKLQVQRKALDVLVDQVPWGFAVVYHRWMADPVHVTW